MRFVFVALGLIAVSALLVQPICEAAERQPAQASHASHVAASGGDEGDACCSMAALDAVAASVFAGAPNLPAAAPVVASPVFRPQILVSDALPAAALPPPLVSRYYVRSARIQR